LSFFLLFCPRGFWPTYVYKHPEAPAPGTSESINLFSQQKGRTWVPWRKKEKTTFTVEVFRLPYRNEAVTTQAKDTTESEDEQNVLKAQKTDSPLKGGEEGKAKEQPSPEQPTKKETGKLRNDQLPPVPRGSIFVTKVEFEA
jgi:hypothetical protein